MTGLSSYSIKSEVVFGGGIGREEVRGFIAGRSWVLRDWRVLRWISISLLKEYSYMRKNKNGDRSGIRTEADLRNLRGRTVETAPNVNLR